jgi:hypothetical protein
LADSGNICHSLVTAKKNKKGIKMGTIRKRGDYQFQAQVRRAGYPPQSKTFDARKDAEKWCRAIEREMDTGTFIPRGEAERTTIAALAKRYIEERVEAMSSKRQETQRVNAIVAKFGTYSLSAVTPAIISEWRKELEKKPLAPQTVHTYMSVLGRLYKAAAIDFGIPLPLGNPEELLGGQVRLVGPISSARSLVILPLSTVSTQTFSSVSANFGDLGRVVELAAILQALRPGEDRRDRVGRGRLALLVLAVVARHGAVRGLGLDGLAVGVRSTEVIRPSEPKPCATVSDCTSPS